MKADIFGYEYMEAIGREDMDQVFKHLELCLGVIDTYIRFLYDKVTRPRGLEERFAFLGPNTVNLGLIITKPDEVIDGHWLLVAINPVREIVYYLDSLDNDWTTYPNLKMTIDTVLQAFRLQRDIQVPKNRANNITWIKVQYFDEFKCAHYLKDQLDELMEE
ncbi:uncharacterized protein LOC131640562 [Vicia villosa]|uniref:uncharacterized protein LOC131640562 n=1 Tax=Vicia villosa TaxID=3911 RepID=UPI00273C7CBC|nr:uncharacterized protein LOC131640562 [Vicia villosa]